jgi:excisionase family DNA binding protein
MAGAGVAARRIRVAIADDYPRADSGDSGGLPMTPRLAYSLPDAAQALGLSVRSLRYLMQQRKLGYARIGRRVLIPASELERLLRRASVKATEPLDADEGIRPAARPQNGNALELDGSRALKTGAAATARDQGGCHDSTPSA